MRSWDAKLRDEVKRKVGHAPWQIEGFIDFFESEAIHALLINLTPLEREFRQGLTRMWGRYLAQIGGVEPFREGDVIDGWRDGVKVCVESVSEDSDIIALGVLETTEYWSGLGMTIGRRIEFRRTARRSDRGNDTWGGAACEGIPWFILAIETNGKKTFMHT